MVLVLHLLWSWTAIFFPLQTLTLSWKLTQNCFAYWGTFLQICNSVELSSSAPSHSKWCYISWRKTPTVMSLVGVAWLKMLYPHTKEQSSSFFFESVNQQWPFRTWHVWQDFSRRTSLLCLVLDLSALCVPCSSVPVPGITPRRVLSANLTISRPIKKSLHG